MKWGGGVEKSILEESMNGVLNRSTLNYNISSEIHLCIHIKQFITIRW